jgi:hypothetical protein
MQTNDEWMKHNETDVCPTLPTDMIEVETWTAGSYKEPASSLAWKYVKFYRVIKNE